MIDERVCEACGDCGVQSNCLSLHSTETEFGRKTVIDQASCNVDASCLKGDCPAFITVKPGKAKKTKRSASPDGEIPAPTLVVPADVAIRMPGIGGTGVVTVSQVLAAAAQIAGVDAKTADQTGLSQKAGPVVSTVTLGDPTPGQIGVLLAFDALASSTPANLAGLDAESSVAVVSTSIAPTGRMIGKVASHGLDLTPLRTELAKRTDAGRNLYVDAAQIVTALLGNAVTANVFMVGVAYQAGFIRCRARRSSGRSSSTERLSRPTWRRFVGVGAGRSIPARSTRPPAPASPTNSSRTRSRGSTTPLLRELVERRAGDLVAYQNRRYAKRYVDVVVEGSPCRAGCRRRWQVRNHRGRSTAPRDGLQGRVRGRPFAAGRQGQGCRSVRRRRQDDVEPLPADVAVDGARTKAAVRLAGRCRCWRPCDA